MTEVSAIARLKIHEGKLEEFKRLAALCVHSVRTKDSDTLQYDYFFNDDYTECVVFERYRDFAATREHLANIGDDITQALLSLLDVGRHLRDAHTRVEESDRRARHPALLAVPADVARTPDSVVCSRARKRCVSGCARDSPWTAPQPAWHHAARTSITPPTSSPERAKIHTS